MDATFPNFSTEWNIVERLGRPRFFHSLLTELTKGLE